MITIMGLCTRDTVVRSGTATRRSRPSATVLNLFLGYHPYYINIYNDKKLYFMISASGE